MILHALKYFPACIIDDLLVQHNQYYDTRQTIKASPEITSANHTFPELNWSRWSHNSVQMFSLIPPFFCLGLHLIFFHLSNQLHFGFYIRLLDKSLIFKLDNDVA